MPTVDIEKYVTELIERLKQKFAERLIYVGLQGSFRRGEADENSDIDIMVTLDRLTETDLDSYREIIAGLPAFERSCGFISGRDELKNWPRQSRLYFTAPNRVNISLGSSLRSSTNPCSFRIFFDARNSSLFLLIACCTNSFVSDPIL